MISSAAYLQWEEDALWQLKGKPIVKTYPSTISCVFWVKDKRRRDNSNMLDSVQDVLVKAGILEDDNCWLLDVGSLHAELDPLNPRVEVEIEKSASSPTSATVPT